MLVLCRRPGEKVVIGNGITLTVVEVAGNKVRVGIDAPDDVRILRGELVGGQDGPAPGHEPLDPDLAGRPAEWNDDTPMRSCHANVGRNTTTHERSGSLRRPLEGHRALKRHGLRC
jgi:carbon storage regulator